MDSFIPRADDVNIKKYITMSAFVGGLRSTILFQG